MRGETLRNFIDKSLFIPYTGLNQETLDILFKAKKCCGNCLNGEKYFGNNLLSTTVDCQKPGGHGTGNTIANTCDNHE